MLNGIIHISSTNLTWLLLHTVMNLNRQKQI